MGASAIVVGVDGSEASRAALRWAAAEARDRGAALRVVHAWQTYPLVVPGSPARTEQWEGLRRRAEELVRTVVVEELGDPPPAGTAAAAIHGPCAATLVEAARDAELIVVGSRGLGGFRALLLGSVGQQVVQHARCPVVVVRADRTDDRRAASRRPTAVA